MSAPYPSPAAAAQRYEEITRVKQQTLFSDVRIVLQEYVILRDLQANGELSLWLRFRQYSDRILSAVLAEIECTDVWGNRTETLSGVQFLDLQAACGAEFGKTTPVKLSDPNSRKITLRIKGVMYQGEAAAQVDAAGEPLPDAVPLSQALPDPALLGQFRRETTPQASVIPLQQGSFRRCCCGASFAATSPLCPRCGADFNTSLTLLQGGALQEKLNAYLAAEEEKRRLDASAREKKKKTAIKAAAAGAAAVILTGLILVSVFFLLPTLRYASARKAMENRNYDKAIDTFLALGTYQDAQALATRAKYLKATDLMETQQYADAKAIFEDLGDYEDSSDLADACAVECDFLQAKQALEDKNYAEAAEIFDRIKSEKSEAKACAGEAHYLYGKALLDEKNYTDAMTQFSAADGYEDAAAMLRETQYRYGMERFEKKDYKTAYSVLSKIRSYKDVSEKYSEVCYQYALERLSAKAWSDAVDLFSDLGNYSQSITKLKEAKYGYVTANKNRSDRTTYTYLKDLIADGYRDCASIYTSLYAWHVSAVINDSDTNTTAEKSTISKYKTVYCHITLTGGTPGESIRLRADASWPNGASNSYLFENMWYDGGTGYYCCWYDTPANGSTGTLRIRIYNNASDDLLGTFSVTLTN